MVKYINHTIWRYIKHNPNQYKLLDIRHNIMKNLILGNCNHLIKFILFGDEENNDSDEVKNKTKEDENEEFKIKHIPRNKLWRKRHKHEIPENDMELAIYHYKGKILVIPIL